MGAYGPQSIIFTIWLLFRKSMCIHVQVVGGGVGKGGANGEGGRESLFLFLSFFFSPLKREREPKGKEQREGEKRIPTRLHAQHRA